MNQLDIFYNTTNLSGKELSNSKKKAETQNVRIYSIFKNAQKPLTPYEVLSRYNLIYGSGLITSIRRGISDLTKLGQLKKTQLKKIEKNGAINYLWKLA